MNTPQQQLTKEKCDCKCFEKCGCKNHAQAKLTWLQEHLAYKPKLGECSCASTITLARVLSWLTTKNENFDFNLMDGHLSIRDKDADRIEWILSKDNLSLQDETVWDFLFKVFNPTDHD